MYLIVWKRALQKFIQCLEIDIDNALNQNHHTQITGDEILHLGMVRSYRRMIPKKYMMATLRISVNIRNIQHTLDNLYYETKNELFWHGVQNNLHQLQLKMNHYIPCGIPKMHMEPETQLQHYVMRCLEQAFIYWNKLCSLRKN
ncbi:MAG: hypothetical protein ACRCXC_09355 [Legionella sp.]